MDLVLLGTCKLGMPKGEGKTIAGEYRGEPSPMLSEQEKNGKLGCPRFFKSLSLSSSNGPKPNSLPKDLSNCPHRTREGANFLLVRGVWDSANLASPYHGAPNPWSKQLKHFQSPASTLSNKPVGLPRLAGSGSPSPKACIWNWP